MADDKVSVQFGATGEEQIAASTERINKSIESVGTAVEGMQRRFEHVGVALSFAVTALANDQETGLTRAAHAVALLGFAFGPLAGIATTTMAIVAEEIVKNMEAAAKAAEKSSLAIQKSIADVGRGGDFAKGNETMGRILNGDPFAFRGEVADETDAQVLARSKGLNGINEELERMNALLENGVGLTNEQYKEVNDLAPLYTEYEADLRRIKDVMYGVGGEADHVKGGIQQTENDLMNANIAAEKLRDSLKEVRLYLPAQVKAGELPGLGGIEFVGTPSEYVLKQARAAAEAQVQAIQDANLGSRISVKFPKVPDLLNAPKGVIDANKEAARKVQEEWINAFDKINGAVESAFEKMRHGGESFADAMKDIARKILDAFISNEVKVAEASIAGNIAGTQTPGGPGGGLGLFASLAKAVGPSLLAAFAAPHGFDVPSGLSPVTQLHPREMVLPEHLADVVRGMAAGGGSGGDHHIHVNIDGKQVAHAVYNAQKAGHLPRNATGRRA